MSQFPIVVMSFNRPDYLEQVLLSLAEQDAADLVGRGIYLFQDGAVSEITGRRFADDADIDQSVAVFEKIFPFGVVFRSSGNLGVAKNFRRAEEFVFRKLGSECAYFFEDDMIVSHLYLQVLDSMAEQAISNPRIGYFAAYGDHHLSLAEQRSHESKLDRLGHHWAFGLTRRHWLRLDEWLKPYYDLVMNVDYRDRPSPQILDMFRRRGIPIGVSSQDDTKKVGTYALGCVSLNTKIVYGRYIGERGLHMRADKFAERGYSNTKIYDRLVVNFDYPSDDQVSKMIEREYSGRWKNINSQPIKAVVDPKVDVRQDALVLKTDVQEKLIATKLMELLHGSDVYKNFVSLPDLDAQGWNGNHRSLAKVIAQRQPSIVLDVRVWKGQASLHIASELKKAGRDSVLIAIDTFVGTHELWRDESGVARFPISHGRPQLYEQFLTNVVRTGLESHIVPFALAPLDAVRALRKLGIRPQMIHLDAAKDYASVAAEIEAFFELLASGGVLVGDDYSWVHVKKAVQEFSVKRGLNLLIDEPKWMLEKP